LGAGRHKRFVSAPQRFKIWIAPKWRRSSSADYLAIEQLEAGGQTRATIRRDGPRPGEKLPSLDARRSKSEPGVTESTRAPISIPRESVSTRRWPATLDTLESIVALYEAWRKPKKAMEYRSLLPPIGNGE